MSTATILLCGGGIRHRALPIATVTSNAMLPVNGKPVVAWILDDLAARGIDTATVVLRAGDQRLREFLERVYARRMSLRLAPVPDQGGSIVRSLHAGLSANPEADAVRVVLGDTLIEDDLDPHPDFVYVGQTHEPDRWCVATVGQSGEIVHYHDKQHLPGDQHWALAGYYRFQDAGWLLRCVAACLDEDRRELSAVLTRYGQRRALRAQPVQSWLDFGNVDNYASAKLKLLRPRYFNSVEIDPVLHTLTKRSTHTAKLMDEVAWFQSLPPELQVLSPRLLDHGQDGQVAWYRQEYYGYPTLAELFVYGELEADVWLSILRRVLAVHGAMARVQGSVPADALRTMYWTKTWERIEALRVRHPDWTSLLTADVVRYNGRSLRNLHVLAPLLLERVERLVQTGKPGLLHGDLCFSNILFDVPHQIVRLIDPRGSFGEPGPWGDPRYDVAKLRHSACGWYDFILADFCELTEGEDGWHGTLLVPPAAVQVAGSFDKLLREAGFDPQDIKLLEGLLFVSMPPLHEGHPTRQKLMYLYGLSLLDEVL